MTQRSAAFFLIFSVSCPAKVILANDVIDFRVHIKCRLKQLVSGLKFLNFCCNCCSDIWYLMCKLGLQYSKPYFCNVKGDFKYCISKMRIAPLSDSNIWKQLDVKLDICCLFRQQWYAYAIHIWYIRYVHQSISSFVPQAQPTLIGFTTPWSQSRSFSPLSD